MTASFRAIKRKIPPTPFDFPAHPDPTGVAPPVLV